MKDTITYEDFLKLDIRVGKVIAAENVPDSKKLIKLTVYFGEELGERTVLTGMQQWVSSDELVEKQFLFLVNLEPRKMAGLESQGMLMAADQDDSPILIPVPNEVRPGTLIR
ncbi:MAG: methionine--tRNA ligase [bacterium]|nr:methionine--tRNA ligase [bacterium]